jgi:Acetyltransferase (GNAT) family
VRIDIKNDFRRLGIGKKLVQRCIEIARAADEPVLEIECRPESSFPFWKRMGFTLYGNENHAYRIVEKTFNLPARAARISVAFSFFPERPHWDETAAALQTLAVQATAEQAGLQLKRRMVFFGAAYGAVGDPVVETHVAGKRLYRDKAKYDDARSLGIHCSGNVVFIDRIRLPTP